ncbi:hypothetical protein BGX28_006177 [Mortierella sp. GBA30]|nr:hypothetical protein BGX28_006177 [Mortierella sp. GBA30]
MRYLHLLWVKQKPHMGYHKSIDVWAIKWQFKLMPMHRFLGNIGVAKSMLGEIADSSNQSQAFGLFGFAWGIGMIVGPVLGGYLANPATTFPDTFGKWAFFIEYPYFLPCFVAAIGSVIGFIVGYFFLEETVSRNQLHDEKTTPEEPDCDFRYAQHGVLGTESGYVAETVSQDLEDVVTSLKPVDIAAARSSANDTDLERQPLLLSAQQINLIDQQEMSHAPQYGSTATSAPTTGVNNATSQFQLQFNCSSERSSMSKRPVAVCPNIIRQQSMVLGFSYNGIGNSYTERPLNGNAGASCQAYSKPVSSGGLFSTADLSSLGQPTVETIPADARSLSLYGYTTDSFVEGRGRGTMEIGRQSHMSFAPSQVFVLPQDPNNKDPNQPMQLLVVQPDSGLSPLSITTIVAYAMLAFHSIVFEEVYTLYAVTPLASHGLGWNAIQLSTSLASMGIVQLTLQFVIYPKMERRFSAVLLFRCAQLLYACIYLAFPLIRTFAADEDDVETGGQINRVRYLVLTGLVFKYVCSVFSYTSVMVMITNSSPPHLLGMVNGIGQTSASFMRAFGPALGGIVWAWSLSNKLNFPFNYFFVFFLIGTVAVLGFIHSLSIPRELGRKCN